MVIFKYVDTWLIFIKTNTVARTVIHNVISSFISTFYFPDFFKFSCIRSLLGFSMTHFNEWQISVEFEKFWTLAIDPIKTLPNFVFVALSVLVSYLIILSSKMLQIKSHPIKVSTGRLSLEYYCLLILDFLKLDILQFREKYFV